MKKISELTTQSFLGGTNVPANSYLLINYADSANGTPVTKKVSVQELGKAIANDLQLYKKTSGGAVTTSVSNNAYVNGTAEKLVTATQKTQLDNSIGDYRGIVSYDTGYQSFMKDDNIIPNILMYSSTEGWGYFATTSSESFTPINMGGGNVEYDATTDTFMYYEDGESSELHIQPFKFNYGESDYYYIVQGDNGKLYIPDSSGVIDTSTPYTLLSVDGFDNDLSDTTFNYLFYDTQNNKMVTLSDSGVGATINRDYGRPLFYTNGGSFGYYDNNGNLVPVGGITTTT